MSSLESALPPLQPIEPSHLKEHHQEDAISTLELPHETAATDPPVAVAAGPVADLVSSPSAAAGVVKIRRSKSSSKSKDAEGGGLGESTRRRHHRSSSSNHNNNPNDNSNAPATSAAAAAAAAAAGGPVAAIKKLIAITKDPAFGLHHASTIEASREVLLSSQIKLNGMAWALAKDEESWEFIFQELIAAVALAKKDMPVEKFRPKLRRQFDASRAHVTHLIEVHLLIRALKALIEGAVKRRRLAEEGSHHNHSPHRDGGNGGGFSPRAQSACAVLASGGRAALNHNNTINANGNNNNNLSTSGGGADNGGASASAAAALVEGDTNSESALNATNNNASFAASTLGGSFFFSNTSFSSSPTAALTAAGNAFASITNGAAGPALITGEGSYMNEGAAINTILGPFLCDIPPSNLDDLAKAKRKGEEKLDLARPSTPAGGSNEQATAEGAEKKKDRKSSAVTAATGAEPTAEQMRLQRSLSRFLLAKFEVPSEEMHITKINPLVRLAAAGFVCERLNIAFDRDGTRLALVFDVDGDSGSSSPSGHHRSGTTTRSRGASAPPGGARVGGDSDVPPSTAAVAAASPRGTSPTMRPLSSAAAKPISTRISRVPPLFVDPDVVKMVMDGAREDRATMMVGDILETALFTPPSTRVSSPHYPVGMGNAGGGAAREGRIGSHPVGEGTEVEGDVGADFGSIHSREVRAKRVVDEAVETALTPPSTRASSPHHHGGPRSGRTIDAAADDVDSIHSREVHARHVVGEVVETALTPPSTRASSPHHHGHGGGARSGRVGGHTIINAAAAAGGDTVAGNGEEKEREAMRPPTAAEIDPTRSREVHARRVVDEVVETALTPPPTPKHYLSASSSRDRPANVADVLRALRRNRAFTKIAMLSEGHRNCEVNAVVTRMVRRVEAQNEDGEGPGPSSVAAVTFLASSSDDLPAHHTEVTMVPVETIVPLFTLRGTSALGLRSKKDGDEEGSQSANLMASRSEVLSDEGGADGDGLSPRTTKPPRASASASGIRRLKSAAVTALVQDKSNKKFAEFLDGFSTVVDEAVKKAILEKSREEASASVDRLRFDGVDGGEGADSDVLSAAGELLLSEDDDVSRSSPRGDSSRRTKRNIATTGSSSAIRGKQKKRGLLPSIKATADGAVVFRTKEVLLKDALAGALSLNGSTVSGDGGADAAEERDDEDGHSHDGAQMPMYLRHTSRENRRYKRSAEERNSYVSSVHLVAFGVVFRVDPWSFGAPPPTPPPTPPPPRPPTPPPRAPTPKEATPAPTPLPTPPPTPPREATPTPPTPTPTPPPTPPRDPTPPPSPPPAPLPVLPPINTHEEEEKEEEVAAADGGVEDKAVDAADMADLTGCTDPIIPLTLEEQEIAVVDIGCDTNDLQDHAVNGFYFQRVQLTAGSKVSVRNIQLPMRCTFRKIQSIVEESIGMRLAFGFATTGNAYGYTVEGNGGGNASNGTRGGDDESKGSSSSSPIRNPSTAFRHSSGSDHYQPKKGRLQQMLLAESPPPTSPSGTDRQSSGYVGGGDLKTPSRRGTIPHSDEGNADDNGGDCNETNVDSLIADVSAIPPAAMEPADDDVDGRGDESVGIIGGSGEMSGGISQTVHRTIKVLVAIDHVNGTTTRSSAPAGGGGGGGEDQHGAPPTYAPSPVATASASSMASPQHRRGGSPAAGAAAGVNSSSSPSSPTSPGNASRLWQGSPTAANRSRKAAAHGGGVRWGAIVASGDAEGSRGGGAASSNSLLLLGGGGAGTGIPVSGSDTVHVCRELSQGTLKAFTASAPEDRLIVCRPLFPSLTLLEQEYASSLPAVGDGGGSSSMVGDRSGASPLGTGQRRSNSAAGRSPMGVRNSGGAGGQRGYPYNSTTGGNLVGEGAGKKPSYWAPASMDQPMWRDDRVVLGQIFGRVGGGDTVAITSEQQQQEQSPNHHHHAGNGGTVSFAEEERVDGGGDKSVNNANSTTHLGPLFSSRPNTRSQSFANNTKKASSRPMGGDPHSNSYSHPPPPSNRLGGGGGSYTNGHHHRASSSMLLAQTVSSPPSSRPDTSRSLSSPYHQRPRSAMSSSAVLLPALSPSAQRALGDRLSRQTVEYRKAHLAKLDAKFWPRESSENRNILNSQNESKIVQRLATNVNSDKRQRTIDRVAKELDEARFGKKKPQKLSAEEMEEVTKKFYDDGIAKHRKVMEDAERKNQSPTKKYVQKKNKGEWDQWYEGMKKETGKELREKNVFYAPQ